MIEVFLGAIGMALVAGVWPFRRGTSGSGAGDQAAVDQRDWIYGDGTARKGARGNAEQAQDDGSPEDDEAKRHQLLEETRRRAELEARTIVERAEREARAIVAAAGQARDAATADGKTDVDASRADEVVSDAEEEARRILAEATAAGARVDTEAARVGSLLMEERAKLASFLKELLEEVEASVELGPQVLLLDEARERKQSAGTTD